MSSARQILFEVIQREGPTLLANAVKKRIHSAAATPLALQEGATSSFRAITKLIKDGREHGVKRTFSPYLKKAKQLPGEVKNKVSAVKKEYQLRKDWRGKADFVLGKAVETGSFVAGAYLGLSVPHLDAKFFPRKNPVAFITLHSAPKVIVEISIEWMRAVLEHARNHPHANADNIDEIAGAERILAKLAGGMETGLAVKTAQRAALGKRFKNARVVGIRLTERGYHLVEYLLTSLAKR